MEGDGGMGLMVWFGVDRGLVEFACSVRWWGEGG